MCLVLLQMIEIFGVWIYQHHSHSHKLTVGMGMASFGPGNIITTQTLTSNRHISL